MIQIFKSPFEGVTVYNPSINYSYLSSTAFTVSVFDDVSQNYSSAFVYKCGHSRAWAPWENNEYSVFGAGVTGYPPNHFSPWRDKQNAQFNYLTFGISDETKVKVGYKKGTVTSVDIGPYNKNLGYSIIAPSSIEISGINPYDKISVIVNNDASTPLYLFADPIHTPPSPTSVDVYFSAGIWEISSLNFLNSWDFNSSSNFRYNQLTSNSIVYFEGGSYVDGTFLVRGLNNVIFSGPGVIDAYRPDDWWEQWEYGATGKIDKDKLVRTPFMAFSSFSDDYVLTQITTSDISLNDVTIVNSIIYGSTCNVKTANNIKLISQYPNCDGFHIDDKSSPLSNRYASMTHSFLQTADDTCYPGNNESDVLISSCYFINLAGCIFRNYAGMYNFPLITDNVFTFSAIDIDCRLYSPPSYANINVGLNETFRTSIFGLIQSDKKKNIALYGSNYQYNAIQNLLFSGIRVDLFDNYLFDLGVRSYFDDGEYSDVFGNISSIIFKDISASTLPYRKYDLPKSNLIYGTEKNYRPHDVSFINVRIDGKPITNVNKDDYFYWYDKPIQTYLSSTANNPPYNGSSVVDLYVIVGDSIADGYDSKYSQRTGSIYENLPSEVTGCYIWVPYNYNATGSTGWVPRFETLRPGVNVPTGFFYNTAVYNGAHVTGIAALESTLGWKLRQNSGNRDVYIVKFAQGGSMAVCGVSSVNTIIPVTGAGPYYLQGGGFVPQDWSISSTDEMFTGFSSAFTSALNNLRNQYKHIDFKGGVICLGTNLPIETMDPVIIGYDTGNNAVTGTNPYLNAALVQSRINTDLSSLVSGIRTIAANNNVDVFNNNFIWMPPIWDSLGEYFVNQDALVYNNYFTSFRNKIKSLSSAIVPSGTNVSIKATHYYAPTATAFRADFVHYNFSGYAQMAEDMYQIFQNQTSSVTDPDINPDVNITFRISERSNTPFVKINNTWKESDVYVKVNGQWKFSESLIKVDDNWRGGELPILELYSPGVEQLRSSSFQVDILGNQRTQYEPAYVFSMVKEADELPMFSVEFTGIPYDPVINPYRNRLFTYGTTPEISYLTFGSASSVSVKVRRVGSTITSAKLRPKSKNYSYEIVDGELIIDMDPMDKVWVETNNETSSPLLIFCDPPKPPIPESNCAYFGPGIHHLSAIPGPHQTVTLTGTDPTGGPVVETFHGVNFSSFDYFGYVQGQPFTIYLDGGSYVVGSLLIQDMPNLKIIGPGIISLENIERRRFNNQYLSYLYPTWNYQAQRDAGGIAIHGNDNYDQIVGNGSFNRQPSGVIVSGVTIVNTPFFGIRGVNGVDSVKIISPLAANTDGANVVGDRKTKFAYIRDTFYLIGDDCIYAPHNAKSPDAYPIGGTSAVFSGMIAYTVNNNPLALSYNPRFYYDLPTADKTYEVIIRDIVAGLYSYNKPTYEAILRMTTDGPANADPAYYGVYDIVVSNVTVEEPIDGPLFRIGNVKDPYNELGFNTGAISGITIANISVSSSIYNNGSVSANAIHASSLAWRPHDITFKNIMINNQYITNANRDNFIDWGPSPYTDPDVYPSNITFVTGTL
jgi:hypothetical protein